MYFPSLVLENLTSRSTFEKALLVHLTCDRMTGGKAYIMYFPGPRSQSVSGDGYPRYCEP